MFKRKTKVRESEREKENMSATEVGGEKDGERVTKKLGTLVVVGNVH